MNGDQRRFLSNVWLLGDNTATFTTDVMFDVGTHTSPVALNPTPSQLRHEPSSHGAPHTPAYATSLVGPLVDVSKFS